MQKMQENEFNDLKFNKKVSECEHKNLCKLYMAGMETDYACLDCGMKAFNKEDFNVKKEIY